MRSVLSVQTTGRLKLSMFLIKHHDTDICVEAEALEIGKLAASCYSHSGLGKNPQYTMNKRQGRMLV